MMVFYRKYRPQKFADIVGQEKVVETILAQLISGKIGHGYLFAGPRGTGKTSTARIFAKAVNCRVYSKQKVKRSTLTKFGEPCNKCLSCLAVSSGSHLDLVEIDGASNRGIDEVRDLREKIKLSPVSGPFKVYIIDEAQMLTTEAFNALLKTLEEPPAHAIFILCTTAPGKLPATIISRLMRFNFTRASDEQLVTALEKVAKSEGIKVEKEANRQIAKAADGSFRDALSILDQLAATGHVIGAGDVGKIALTSGWSLVVGLVEDMAKGNLKGAILLIEEYTQKGGDVSFLINEVVSVLEKILVVKVGAAETLAVDWDSQVKDKVMDLTGMLSFAQLQTAMKLFLIAESEVKIYPLAKIPLILAVCKFCGEPQESQESESKSESKVESFDQKAGGKVAKVSKHAPKKLVTVEKHWQDFLGKVKLVNAGLVALLRSTRPSAFDGDSLSLEVFYKFHKEKLEEPKIMRMLEDILEDVFKQKINLKVVLAAKEARPTPSVAASDVVDVRAEELSRLAAEVFSK